MTIRIKEEVVRLDVSVDRAEDPVSFADGEDHLRKDKSRHRLGECVTIDEQGEQVPAGVEVETEVEMVEILEAVSESDSPASGGSSGSKEVALGSDVPLLSFRA